MDSSNKNLKLILKAIGYVITIASFIYIINQILALKFDVLNHLKSFRFFFYLTAFSFLYTTIIFIAALNWKIIIRFFANTVIPFKIILQVYLKSNIAKYLPGNVMHYAGRNYLGSKFGMKHSDIAISSVFEIVLVIITTGILTSINLFTNIIALPKELTSNIKLNHEIIFFILGVILIITCMLLIRKRNLIIRTISRLFSINFITLLAKTIILVSFTFIFGGLILVSIYIFIFDIVFSLKDFIATINIFIISWFLGYITPGAPGGIGVRETALILMLSPILGKESTLMASIILRLVTTISDVIAFLLGYSLSLKIREESTIPWAR